MKDHLVKCPKCDSELVITKYTCPHCLTEITGEFYHDKFSRLQENDLEFIEIFIRNRGSIKEIEKELSISYPTVRNRLDQVIKSLGHTLDPSASKMEILQKLKDGEISSEEAADMIREIQA